MRLVRITWEPRVVNNMKNKCLQPWEIITVLWSKARVVPLIFRIYWVRKHLRGRMYSSPKSAFKSQACWPITQMTMRQIQVWAQDPRAMSRHYQVGSVSFKTIERLRKYSRMAVRRVGCRGIISSNSLRITKIITRVTIITRYNSSTMMDSRCRHCPFCRIIGIRPYQLIWTRRPFRKGMVIFITYLRRMYSKTRN